MASLSVIILPPDRQKAQELIPHTPRTTVTVDSWLNADTTIPIFRQNRLGYQSNPFNLQIIGPLSDVITRLTEDHWLVHHNHDTILTRLHHLLDTESLIIMP